MSVRIRFSLLGKPGQRSFRLEAIDSRYKRNSNNFLEILGFYNPNTKIIKLKGESIKKWISYGAQPASLKIEKLIKKHLGDLKQKNKNNT